MANKFLTAESVTAGHPDKLCDIIADSILDACLLRDPSSRVACEVLATKGLIIVAGEITCEKKIAIKRIVKSVLKEVGYNPRKFRIKVKVHRQSPDIASGVNRKDAEIGAGDQGIMHGYATDETDVMLPLPVVLANRITERLTEVFKSGEIKGIGPDGKSQVTVEYKNGKPVRIKTIIVSVQHSADKDTMELHREIIHTVIMDACGVYGFDTGTEILINPSGRFVLGGPEADTGLTGRKLMVDTYGGIVQHGGGAFSGKDCTKVDRSAAYYARYVAKNIVAAGLAKKCLVSVAYAIGRAKPVMVDIETYGTATVPVKKIKALCKKNFDFRPRAIIDELDLTEPVFADFCANCHFMHSDATWEDTDKADDLKED